jgi:hypothetical protein
VAPNLLARAKVPVALATLSSGPERALRPPGAPLVSSAQVSWPVSLLA